ncbi:hypothetical protein ACM9XA_03600 [Xanthomonas sacchari]
MALALNYARMPGPGDLWQPPEDPAFDRDDAVVNVAANLVKEDEVAELVMNVANARALLAWIATESEIPRHLWAEWAALERQAIALDQRINREFAILNGEEA